MVGGRVLVPFRQQRMTGIVVELHDRKPSVTTKTHSQRARCRAGARRTTAAPRPLDCRLLSRSARRSVPHHAAAECGVQTRHRLPHHQRRPTGAASGGNVGIVRALAAHSGRASRRIPRARLSGCAGASARRDHSSSRRESALRHSSLEINPERDGAEEMARARRCLRRSRRHAHHQDRAAQIRRRQTERQPAPACRDAGRIWRPGSRGDAASARSSANDAQHAGQARSD